MYLSRKTLLVAGGRSGALALALSSGFVLSACSFGPTTPLPDGSIADFDGGYVPPKRTAGGDTADDTTEEESDAGLKAARVRVAHFLQKAGPVELCFRPGTGGAWSGPVFSAAGLANGLSFGQVSARFPVAGTNVKKAAPFEFRLVPGGAGCDVADGSTDPGATVKVELGAGGAATLVAFGEAGGTRLAAPRFTSLEDALSPADDGALVRTFHGSYDTPPLDVAIANTPVASGVRYGSASPGTSPSSVNSVFAPVPLSEPIGAGAPLVLKAGTTSVRFVLPEIKVGQVISLFAVGRSAQGAEPKLGVVMCVDSIENGSLATCESLRPL